MIKTIQISVFCLYLISCSTQESSLNKLTNAISTNELSLHKNDFDGRRVLLDGYFYRLKNANGFLLINSRLDESTSGKAINYCLGNDKIDVFFEKSKMLYNFKNLNLRHVAISGVFINKPVEVYDGVSYFYPGEIKDVKIEILYDDRCVIRHLTN